MSLIPSSPTVGHTSTQASATVFLPNATQILFIIRPVLQIVIIPPVLRVGPIPPHIITLPRVNGQLRVSPRLISSQGDKTRRPLGGFWKNFSQS